MAITQTHLGKLMYVCTLACAYTEELPRCRGECVVVNKGVIVSECVVLSECVIVNESDSE